MIIYSAYFLEENITPEHGMGNITVENVDSVKLLELGNGYAFWRLIKYI